jgi:folate-binding protein YgfZ
VSAGERGPLLADRSGLARLRGVGKDLLGLLHRLTTQDLAALPVGAGLPAVLTSPKGRIVERLFVHRAAEREVFVVAGEGRAAAILDHFRKYTFAEETGLEDVTETTALFSLLGDGASGILPDPGPWGTRRGEIEGLEVVVLGHDGFTSEGRSVLAAREGADSVRAALRARATEIDAAALESWRVLRGLPASGSELTEDWNPLEAGLRDHVSFTKGCYVGQEVVARLNTYDKVSRRLVRLRIAAGAPVPSPGDEVRSGGKGVGRVTSVVRAPDGAAVALAYVKAREPSRDTFSVGEAEAALVTD